MQVKNQLNLIYLVDTSGSMIEERINQLNLAMSEAVKVAEKAAQDRKNPADLQMRVVQFNSDAQWILGNREQGLRHIDWLPLEAEGATNTAKAIDLATSVMHRKYLGVRNLPPIVILITDAYSNNPEATKKAVDRLRASLKSSKGNDKIMRIAIGVSGANRAELEYFASHVKVLCPDGRIVENVPLVFEISDVVLLRDLLINLTQTSIMSSIQSGIDGDDDSIVFKSNGSWL